MTFRAFLSHGNKGSALRLAASPMEIRDALFSMTRSSATLKSIM